MTSAYEQAAKLAAESGTASCTRGSTDPDTGVFECSKLDRGDCGCTDFDDLADRILALGREQPARAAPARHELKTSAAYFDAVERGEKKFEVRRDDRGFQRGDTVVLARSLPEQTHLIEYGSDGQPRYQLEFTIGWILTGGQLGIEPGYIVFSLEKAS